MTDAIIQTRAKRHDLILRKDGHGEYLLLDKNNCVAVPGSMSLVQVALWLDDLDGQTQKTNNKDEG